MRQFGRQRPRQVDRYQPKGSMCMSCVHRERDCSFLPFNTMHVIYVERNRVGIVRCTDYQRDTSLQDPSDKVQ